MDGGRRDSSAGFVAGGSLDELGYVSCSALEQRPHNDAVGQPTKIARRQRVNKMFAAGTGAQPGDDRADCCRCCAPREAVATQSLFSL